MELDLNADGRWAVWALDETRVLLSTHLSPTPPAAMLLACLLWTHTQGPRAMVDGLLAGGKTCRDGNADGRGSRSVRVSRRVCVERIRVLPIGSTSINLGLVS